MTDLNTALLYISPDVSQFNRKVARAVSEMLTEAERAAVLAGKIKQNDPFAAKCDISGIGSPSAPSSGLRRSVRWFGSIWKD